MTIELIRDFVIFPGAATELGLPIIRRAPIRPPIPPDVPIALYIVPGRAAFHKPGMLVRRMVRHEIKKDFDTVGVGSRDERVEIIKRAKQWIDVKIIRNVVAEIGHRRTEDG